MQEPGTRVVSSETDDYTGTSNTDDITTRWVDEVQSSTVRRLDNVEGYKIDNDEHSIINARVSKKTHHAREDGRGG